MPPMPPCNILRVSSVVYQRSCTWTWDLLRSSSTSSLWRTHSSTRSLLTSLAPGEPSPFSLSSSLPTRSPYFTYPLSLPQVPRSEVLPYKTRAPSPSTICIGCWVVLTVPQLLHPCPNFNFNHPGFTFLLPPSHPPKEQHHLVTNSN